MEIANWDVAAWIDSAIARNEVVRLNLPHVVHVLDRLTGLSEVFGPFASPIDASSAAERYVREVGCDYEWALLATVIPLDSGTDLLPVTASKRFRNRRGIEVGSPTRSWRRRARVRAEARSADANTARSPALQR